MSTSQPRSVEELLEVGLRNTWYGIAPSHFVKDKPISLRRCGYKMVLWREIDGRLHALEDHCPHRGAPLSLGIPQGDRIACGYHGVQVDGSGVAVRVPGSPGCKLEGMKATKSFPVQERNGMIFAYVGDRLHEEPPPLVLPEELTAPEFSSFLCYVEWGNDYRYAVENALDPMHGTFLHKQSHTMSFGATQAEFHTRDTETGFVFEKTNQRGVNFDWVEYGETGISWLRLEIPYPKSAGPGGGFQIVAAATPIEKGKAALMFWRCRKVQGWRRDAWRFLYRNRLERRHWSVLEQDRTMIEGMEIDARDREVLYQHDIGVVRYRRRLQSAARAQLSELSAESPVREIA